MKFAYKKIIITPSYPVYMNGYHRDSKSNGVLQDLEANAILIEFEHQVRWLHIIIDSINVNESFTKQLQQHFSQTLHLPKQNIVVSATHTHSAPAYFELVFDKSTGYPEYVNDLQDKLYRGLNHLDSELRDGTILFSSYTFSGFYGNRNTLNGPCDPSAYLLEFIGSDGIRQAVYANLSIHPTFYNGANLALSPDLIGEFRHRISAFLDAPSMICNGTCGDVSTRFYREQYPTLSSVGDVFEKQLKEQYQPVSLTLKFKYLSSFEKCYTINHRIDNVSNVLKNQQRDTDSPLSKMFYQRMLLKQSWNSFSLSLQSTWIDLDDLLIVFLPGDVCSQFGLDLKKHFPNQHVIVVGYTNQYCNYMVPDNDYGLYFETFTSRLQYGQAQDFIDKTIEQIEFMK